MTGLPPSVVAGIAAACRFHPEVLVAFGVTSIAEAVEPGRASMLVPVREGNADMTYRDASLSDALTAGVVVILAFQRRKDARRFDHLLAAERAAPPAATHAAPVRPQ